MHVVPRKLGREEPIEEIGHLLLRERLAGLDRALAGEALGDPLVLVPGRVDERRAFGQLVDHVPEAALGVEVLVRIRTRPNDHRPLAERLDLESHPAQELRQLFRGGVLRG